MSPHRSACLFFLVVNLVSLSIVTHNYFTVGTSMRIATSTGVTTPSDKEFLNGDIANEILKLLDIYESEDYQEEWTPEVAKIKYSRPYMGTTDDWRYCEKHREWFAHNTGVVFDEKNMMTNYRIRAVLRTEVLVNIGGKDLMPYVHSRMPEELQKVKIFDLRPDFNHFFTTHDLFNYRHIGKQFSCLTQISNHIPGHDHLYRKDFNAISLLKYGKNVYQDRTECFNDKKFFPKTWIMVDKEQCLDFFSTFNGPEYQQLKKDRGLVYIRKIGADAHMGEGVFPVNATQEEYINKLYKKGELCGQVAENNLMQYAVWNPLLLNGRKFDFRMFMLIASTNPTMVYYRDGFLRVSLRNYDPDSKELGAILTNIALSKPFFEEAKEKGTYNGYTEEELMNQAFWSMPKLGKFLYDTGRVKDPNWLENYLRPEFKRAMIHLIRMSQATFSAKSSTYEIFGLDFMLDDNMDLWFIEANAQPLLDGWSDDTKRFFNKILYDSFEIVYGLLKSRTKRIVQFVNKLIQEDQVGKVSSNVFYIEDLNAKRKEFKEISKNYFEPEYLPGPDNDYQIILDDNLQGMDRYMGLIESKCL